MLKRTQIYGGRWRIHGRYIGATTRARAIKVITVIFSIPPGLPLPHIRLIDILNTVPALVAATKLYRGDDSYRF